MLIKRFLTSSVRLLKFNVRFMSMKQHSNEVVLTKEVNDNGLMILNRPDVLNAANIEMLEQMSKILNEWKTTKSLIIVRGNGGMAFCAGGDVRAIVKDNNDLYGRRFSRVEYVMNHLIGNLKIPYVALIDGIIMGAGVGMAIHGKYRIATEKTVFAMPETRLGGFPDVGCSHFFPRLQGKLGYYLGLTGSSLKGADVFHAGIATHYCDSSKISALEQELLHLEQPNAVENVINQFCPKVQSEFSLLENLDQINECFDASSVEEIMDKLKKDNSKWAKKTLKVLQMVSPLSLKLTFVQLNLGSKMNSLGECLQMEYRMAYHLLQDSDFFEGLQAMLIRKDNAPKWNTMCVEEVSTQRVHSFFEPLPDNEDLPIYEKLRAKL